VEVDSAEQRHRLPVARQVGAPGATPRGRDWWCCPGTPRRAWGGADRTGALWRHDAGQWTQAGELAGPLQAFLATPDTLYAAASEHDTDRTGIYTSTNGGGTWELRYRDSET
jgi:hypothetical protein